MFRPRGIGMNWLPCFICEGDPEILRHDMASFVADKAAGERVVAMFEELGLKAQLDFRPSEPNWVQVKVAACLDHLPNLKLLYYLVVRLHTSPVAPVINMDILRDVTPGIDV
jgi:hypothetical protein